MGKILCLVLPCESHFTEVCINKLLSITLMDFFFVHMLLWLNKKGIVLTMQRL